MHAVEPFRAFAYEDMPMALASRNSSITATSDRANSYRSSITLTRSRRASAMGTQWQSAIAAHIQPPFVTDRGHSPKNLTCIGPVSATGTQHLPIKETSIDAVSPIDTRHSARTDRRASFGNAKHLLTATASNDEASSTGTTTFIPPYSASRASAQSQPNHKTSAPLPLNLPAGDILTTLIKNQVNLPTKEVIMATGNPLGMVIPTDKKFVLVGGKIRHGRVIEGRVAQVTPAAFEKHMATEYGKAFANGIEELEYPLTEPLLRTRSSDARRPTSKEIRAVVGNEVQDAVEKTVEVIVFDLIEDAVASVVQDLEQEVETIVMGLVEGAVASSVSDLSLVKMVELADPFVA